MTPEESIKSHTNLSVNLVDQPSHDQVRQCEWKHCADENVFCGDNQYDGFHGHISVRICCHYVFYRAKIVKPDLEWIVRQRHAENTEGIEDLGLLFRVGHERGA